MLTELCGVLRNWFETDRISGTYTVENGSIALPFLQEGQKRGNIDDLISDNGTFLRVLSGNRLDDLDKMIEYELKNITTAEEPAERET